MADLFEDVNLLENLSTREVVLHVGFLKGFNGDLFPRELVNSESNFSESAFAN